jgi:Rieske Fe-S protein
LSEATRRGVLAGAAGVAAAAALVACGDSSSPAGSGSTGADGITTSGPAPSSAAATTGGATGSSAALAHKSDIPIGGGKVFGTKDTVITQPTQDVFKAFSATCTHAQCTVASVENGVIKCPCHGSMYSASDGSVKGGPAPKPLTPKQLKIEGENISLA